MYKIYSFIGDFYIGSQIFTNEKINLVNNKIEDEGARALGKIIARRKVHTNISLLKKFFISGCYDNTVYHMIAPLGK